MKNLIITILILVCGMYVSYNMGIHKATTADGWIDNDKFVLEVDGNYYEWWIDEE